MYSIVLIMSNVFIGSIDETSEKNTLDATQKLFGKHYPKLQDIKKKYDPDMLFRLWFPITPSA